MVLGVAIVSALFVVISDMRPSYDGFGFLVWGRQVLHWNLNTDGAPSWKPLPFLFTLPYAVAGRGQMWLWMGTAVAGAVAGSVFAARVAFRLTGGVGTGPSAATPPTWPAPSPGSRCWGSTPTCTWCSSPTPIR